MEPEFHRNVVWLLDGNGYPCGAFQPFQSECRGECDAVPHGYELGLFFPMFDNEGFHWNLLVLYTALACLCSIGGFVLYFWNKGGSPGSFLYGLPIGGLGAETVAVGLYLFHNKTFLFQFLFDLAGMAAIGYVFWKRAENKILYTGTAVVVAAAGYFCFYRLFL